MQHVDNELVYRLEGRFFMGPRDYDRVDRNESDGAKFYGYDRDDGKTEWYDERGDLDCITDTPDYDDEW